MPTMRLTDAAIRKAIQQARDGGARMELTDAASAGLRVRATKDGRAVWSVMIRDQVGKNRRVTLGNFPTLGVADAREQASIMRHRIRHEGADPVAERRAARQQAEEPVAQSLSGVLDEYARIVKHDSLTWPDYRHRIELVFRDHLARQATEITLGDLQRTADTYKSLGTASKAVAYLRPVLKWAADRDYVEFRTTRLSEPRPTEARDRVLSRDELRLIVPVLRGRPGPAGRPAAYAMHRAAMTVLLWTATRLNEACRATWSEFDLDGESPTWTIPVEHIKDTQRGRRKKRRKRPPHVIPLPRQAVLLLRDHRPDGADPNALVFPNGAGGLLGNWDRVAKHLFEVTGTSGWTRHDLRRTAATMMGEMGVAPHVIEAALNHAEIHSPLADTYNRSRYLTEVGEAFQRWADWLEQTLNEAAE